MYESQDVCIHACMMKTCLFSSLPLSKCGSCWQTSGGLPLHVLAFHYCNKILDSVPEVQSMVNWTSAFEPVVRQECTAQHKCLHHVQEVRERIELESHDPLWEHAFSDWETTYGAEPSLVTASPQSATLGTKGVLSRSLSSSPSMEHLPHFGPAGSGG